jgi:hypothetical protein
MAEWLKAAVLKTAEARASVGSNPTPSATLRRTRFAWETRGPCAMGGVRRSFEAARIIDAASSGGEQPAALCSLVSAKASIIHSKGDADGEVAELAEGNRLLSGCTG